VLRAIAEGGGPSISLLLKVDADAIEAIRKVYPPMYDELAEVDIVPPTDVFTDTATLDLGPPSVAATAKALGLSVRSLQRHLAQEQTSFLAVLDEVRRSLAEGYLQNRAHTVSDVAFLVGFSELSAFSRAFRRWTGTTAASYRRGGRDRRSPARSTNTPAVC